MTTNEATKEAVKTEDRQLRDYELVLVVSPEVKSEDIDNTINKISKFVTERSGVISEVARWGKRKLAYPIKHFLEGDYTLVRFKSKPPAVKELEANLRISEEILRHLLTKLEG